jgi:hypothetical protein
MNEETIINSNTVPSPPFESITSEYKSRMIQLHTEQAGVVLTRKTVLGTFSVRIPAGTPAILRFF